MAPPHRDKQHAVKMQQQGVSSVRLRAARSSRNEPLGFAKRRIPEFLQLTKSGLTVVMSGQEKLIGLVK